MRRFVLPLLLVQALLSAPVFYMTDSSGIQRDSISKSNLQRPYWTKGNACLASKVAWVMLEPGLFRGTLYLGRPDSTVVGLEMLRIDPALFGVRVMGSPGNGEYIETMVKNESAVAGINGGYFFIHERTSERMPLGLTVKGGKRFALYRANYSGMLFSDGPLTRFAYKTQPVGEPQEALQSFPMLLFAGRIPEEVRDALNGKLNILERHRRSAVGEDWDGRLVLMATVGELSFQEMGFVSGALGLRHCMALDGGSSTQLCAGGGGLTIVQGLDKVPIGLGVFRK